MTADHGQLFRLLFASNWDAIRLSGVRFLIAALAALLLAATPAAARPGDLDRSFASGGRVAYAFASGGYVAGLVLQDERRPFLSVDALAPGGPTPTALSLTGRGRLASRTAFPPPAVGAPRFSGGYALSRIGDAPARYALFRIGATTGVTLTIPEVLDGQRLALDAGGWGVDRAGRAILTVSYKAELGGPYRARALRYLPDGRLDPSYGRGGVAAVGYVNAIEALVRPDGRLYVLTGTDRHDTRVMALDSRGRRVAGFYTRTLRSGRFARYENPRAIVAAPGGGLLVAGGGLYHSGWVARLRPDGRADRRFGDRGLTAIPDFNANAIARDRRGRIVLAGIADTNADPYQAAVARLTARGRADRSFGRRGVVARQLGAARGLTLVASEARHVAIDARGRIVVAGEAYDNEYLLRDDLGRSHPAIARLHG